MAQVAMAARLEAQARGRVTERMPALEALRSNTQRQFANGFPRVTEYKSKLEASFADFLELSLKSGAMGWYRYEPMSFRIGPDARYRPDFGALVLPTRELWLYEVKGFWREAAKVRIKVAADMYPFFRWWTVEADKSAHYGFAITEIVP